MWQTVCILLSCLLYCLQADIVSFSFLRINMDLPILHLLRSMVDSVLISLSGDEDSWQDYIEEIAPGYLEEEEAGGGFAPDYDHSNFPDDSK